MGESRNGMAELPPSPAQLAADGGREGGGEGAALQLRALRLLDSAAYGTSARFLCDSRNENGMCILTCVF